MLLIDLRPSRTCVITVFNVLLYIVLRRLKQLRVTSLC